MLCLLSVWSVLAALAYYNNPIIYGTKFNSNIFPGKNIINNIFPPFFYLLQHVLTQLNTQDKALSRLQ